MKVPENAPEPVRARLQFQADAAEVQLAISRLMQSIEPFLRQLLADSVWRSPENDTTAAEFVDSYWKEKERWTGLRPPGELQAVWSEIDDGLSDLGLVVEKLPLLGWGGEADPTDRVHALQEEFRSRLDRLAADEDKLVIEEQRLRDTQSTR